MEEQQPTNKFAIPVAIVLAGALIAVALYFNNAQSNNRPTTSENQNQELASGKIEIAAISAKDHLLGNPDAQVTMVVYSDTECPFCKSFHSTAKKIIDTYGKDGKVAMIYRHFPLYKPDSYGRVLHSKAGKEAEALECANELGGNTAFWKYVDRLFEVTPSNDGLDPAELPKIAEFAGLNKTTFTSCLDSNKYADFVSKAYDSALAAGAQGTPYTIIVLKNKIDSAAKTELQKLALPFPAGTIFTSDDNLKVAVSGGVPYTILEQVIQIVLK
ncbi:MAG: DsbA family protein [Candidatus Paceibacterota bacterium]|jgi:protein-disulfide isomerase